MSGAGGFFRNNFNVDRWHETMRNSEKNAIIGSEYETSVNRFLASKLVLYNQRDIERVKRILQKVVESLSDEIQTAINVVFGGSIEKHTYVDGLSDIDALVVIDCDDGDLSPILMKKKLEMILQKHFKGDSIRVGNLAVTLTYDDIELQLLPALKCGPGYKISNAQGDDWSKINPEAFTRKLTETNDEQDGKVVPVIKLVKAIVSDLPQTQQISGYHAESLAIKVFKDYSGTRTLKCMLQYFFETASSAVAKPIKDKTGQSIHVDDYLGEENSLKRRIIAMAFDGISRKMRNADGCQSIEIWQKLFHGVEDE